MTRIIKGGAVYALSLSLPRFKILSRTHHIFEVILSWYFPYFMYIINQDIFHVYFIDMLSNKTTLSDMKLMIRAHLSIVYLRCQLPWLDGNVEG